MKPTECEMQFHYRFVLKNPKHQNLGAKIQQKDKADAVARLRWLSF